MHDEAAAALEQVAILFSYCESPHASSDCLQQLQNVTGPSISIRLNEVALDVMTPVFDAGGPPL